MGDADKGIAHAFENFMTHTPERRNGRRELFTVTVEYALLADDAPEDFRTGGQGLTTNISDTGLGLILTSPVEEGQRINLYGDKLADKLLTGSVRWCTKISDGIYRTGLRFN